MLTVVNVIQWQNKSKILKASPQYWCYYSYLTFFIIVKNCDTLPLLINWNISRLLENNSSDDENLLHTTRDAKSCKIHQHGKIKREHISNRNCLKNSFFSQVACKRVKGSPFLPSLEIVRSFPGSCGPCSGKHAVTLWNFKVFLKLWKYAKFTLSEYCSKYLGIPRKRTAWEYLQVRLSTFRTPWRFISSSSNISNQPGTPNKFLCPHTFFKYQCWSMPLIK